MQGTTPVAGAQKERKSVSPAFRPRPDNTRHCKQGFLRVRIQMGVRSPRRVDPDLEGRIFTEMPNMFVGGILVGTRSGTQTQYQVPPRRPTGRIVRRPYQKGQVLGNALVYNHHLTTVKLVRVRRFKHYQTHVYTGLTPRNVPVYADVPPPYWSQCHQMGYQTPRSGRRFRSKTEFELAWVIIAYKCAYATARASNDGFIGHQFIPERVLTD
eukprot:TRINITY_DN519_c0_g2_i1.p2 TRINITY_DN519_c0_g2~~TRINITY_DN519_c0_g2_i1.p2  ORF type:complete len:212 (-),score=-0.46 TRINITY_DN519_c0_g2_i1:1126-1761(-)